MVEISGTALMWICAIGVVLWVSQGALGAVSSMPLVSHGLQLLGIVFLVQLLLRQVGDQTPSATWNLPQVQMPQVPSLWVVTPPPTVEPA